MERLTSNEYLGFLVGEQLFLIKSSSQKSSIKA